MTRRRLVFGVAGALSAVAVLDGRQAQAHAMLLRADPLVGSSIRIVPDRVTLTFSEGVELAFSTIRVTDAAGTRVDRDDLRRDPAQLTRLTIGLQKLPPGVYRVQWKVTSVDTHKTEGSFAFTVLPPGAA